MSIRDESREENAIWKAAQEGEKEWWGDCRNTYGEEEKQIQYAEKMGLKRTPDSKTPYLYDMGGKTICDFGGGPVSMFLKCKNVKGTVVDPLEMPGWVIRRYEDAGITYIPKKAEDFDIGLFDEVWIYNVLQHSDDPEKIIRNARKIGKLVRIFEWVDTPPNTLHPHELKAEKLDEWLGGKGTVETTDGGRSPAKRYFGQFPGNGHQSMVSDIGQSSGFLEDEEYMIPERPKRPKRFHLLALPHVAANDEALACAFSQKVVKMGRMLKSLGHTVYAYGVEGSVIPCDEFVEVSTQDILRQTYGDYDMKAVIYKHAQDDLACVTFNENAIIGIKERMQPNDFLLIPFCPQRYRMILNALDTKFVDSVDKLHLVVEMGIGYRGTVCRYKVFESISQMHFNYGLSNAENMGAKLNGNAYDCVIPNYFDPSDFEFSDKKEDFFLYLGRVVHRKGIADAIRTVETIGGKLIVAGQDGGEGVKLNSPNVEYVGFADVEKRRQLLRDAKALFLPTWYIEPFGGTIIEAAFSGTPVITSDWGAFPELVRHGKTGYRCHTLDHYTWAADNIGNIKPIDCYNYAMNNFSLDRVRWMYEEYFNMLLDVKENVNGQGWSRLHPERTQLDWLERE
jgi:hypothetical protein